MSSPRLPPGAPTALDIFRSSGQRIKLHPLEKALIWVVGLQLVFTPWALGTVHAWSQSISFALSLLSFVVALWPRHYTEETAREGRFKLVIWPKLIKSPVFWIGLTLMAYLLIQALNPAWTYRQYGKTWWMRALPHIRWLPTGVEAPFEQGNTWRGLMYYGSAWLTLCALGVGITRRVSVQAILAVVAVNGALLAMVGIVQKVLEAPKVLWFIDPPAWYFVSTIFYKNHAGAFFNLVVALSAALAYWFFLRGERRLERSNPAPVFAFATVLAGMLVLLSNSRGSTLLLLLFLVFSIGGFVIRRLFFTGEGGNPVVLGVVVVTLLVFVGLGGWYLKLESNVAKVERLFSSDKSASVDARRMSAAATWDMAKDSPVLGSGAGSFRYLFPKYQKKYPAIDQVFWRHAHNDYVEFLAEFGIVGSVILLAAFVAWGLRLVRNGIGDQPYAIVLLVGLLCTLAHCWVDFQSFCGAVLITWCVGAAVLTRWVELESDRVGR